MNVQAPAAASDTAAASAGIPAIDRVGVIGAGQMGNGIAHVCALAGIPVVLLDVKQDALDKAMAVMGRNLDRQVNRTVISELDKLETREHRRQFLLNLICFATCIEGLFFFAAFAYVYFLRSRGLLHGLAAGTNWVFRDESAHMAFAFEVVKIVREQEPDLFDDQMAADIAQMLDEAVECETLFAADLLSGGVVGLSVRDMRQYLEYVADQRLTMLGLPVRYNSKNPFPFMELQDVQELANFFERRVSAYQVGVTGEVTFDASF